MNRARVHDGACTNFVSHSGLALSRQTFAGVAVRLHRPRKAGRCRLGRVPHETQQQRVEAWVDHVRTPRESASRKRSTTTYKLITGAPAFAGTTAWSRATTAFWFQSAV